jgi:hypothetical protein
MRDLLFSIDRIEFVGGGQTMLAGRCCRDPIRAGDEARFLVFREEDGRFEKFEPILVRFQEFQLYGKEVREVPSGYTAGALLPNEMTTGLRFGWYLKGENA